MPQPVIDILIILILILANSAFAMSEMAMVASRPARLQQQADSGNRGARIALELKKNPNRLLSTVQVGATLVGIFSGALGGATLSPYLAPLIDQIPLLAPYSQALSLVLVVLGITYLSLVIGELAPKRLALNNPERIAAAVAAPMNSLSWLASPIVNLMGASTDLALRLVGARSSVEPLVTDEEIKILLEQGARVGIFEEAEQDIVASVFRLSDRRVDAIMTPRTEMVWLDLDDPIEKILNDVTESRHAVLPVAQGSLDNVQGILLVKDLLEATLSGTPLVIPSILRPAIFVPESTPALKVLEEVKNSGLTLAMVLDEYGGISGMVTLIDILKSIVGDIPQSDEEHEPLVVRRPDGSWLLDGLLQVDELKALLDLQSLPDEDRVGYQTLGGLVMSQLKTIPTTGETFDWEGYRFEVVDMDGRRVDKVLVYQTPTALELLTEDTTP